MFIRTQLCLEYSLSVMCMGYGNTLPVTVAELWFSLAMMLIAGSVYAFVIGGICGAVATEDPATAERLQGSLADWQRGVMKSLSVADYAE